MLKKNKVEKESVEISTDIVEVKTEVVEKEGKGFYVYDKSMNLNSFANTEVEASEIASSINGSYSKIK